MLFPILKARACLQHRACVRSQPTSSIAPKLAKLASTIGSARSLWGLWGTCFRFLAAIFLKPQAISTKKDVTYRPVAHCPRAPCRTHAASSPSNARKGGRCSHSPPSRSSPSSVRMTSSLLRFPPSLPPARKAPTRGHQRQCGLAVVDAPLDDVRRAPARTPARGPRLAHQATTKLSSREELRPQGSAPSLRVGGTRSTTSLLST